MVEVVLVEVVLVGTRRQCRRRVLPLSPQRGAMGTAAAHHRRGDPIALLDVDTWPRFIRFDQETDIQDEVAQRIGRIMKQTGPYEMVYFDGSEDVHEPFWYHCANAQWRVYRQIRPEPPVCESYLNTHFSWHMMSRGNAYDSVHPSKLKRFCREYPCQDAARLALDFTRVDFGWVHHFGRRRNVYLTPDALEYVFSRAAAWDCPCAISIGLQDVHNPRAESCLEVVRIWEDARIAQKLTDAQREELKKLDQEHHLFVNQQDRYELVAIHPVPTVGSGQAARAYTFRRASVPDRTYVLLWAIRGRLDMTLAVPSDRVRAMRPFGRAVPVRGKGGMTTVAVGERIVLGLVGIDDAQARDLLRTAEVSTSP